MAEEGGKRPIGVTILAGLHIVGGGLGLLLVPLLAITLFTRGAIPEGLNQLGFAPPLIVLLYFVLFTMALMSGLGLWRGRWWGWHLGAIYYLYSMSRSIGALVHLPQIFGSIPAEALEEMERSPEYYAIKYAGRTLVHALVYLYLFKASVRNYCSIGKRPRWNSFLTHLLIYAIVMTMRNLVMD